VAFDVDLSLRAFFEQPTIAGLALLIMQRMSEVSPCEEIDRLLNSLENAGILPSLHEPSNQPPGFGLR
jgi:hypothetical protein